MDRAQCIAQLKDVLVKASEERRERPEWIEGELGWIHYERYVMWDETNRLRAQLGKGPVSIDDIKRVEQGATGHSDYVAKFAIGCAELVAQGEPSYPDFVPRLRTQKAWWCTKDQCVNIVSGKCLQGGVHLRVTVTTVEAVTPGWSSQEDDPS